MLFSRVASFFMFVLSLGILAVAKPVQLEDRANSADIQNVIATLKSKTDSIVPQIKSAAQNPSVSASTVTPLINELITALNTAHSSIGTVSIRELDKRQNQQEVATQFASVVQDIAGAVNLLPKGLPGLGGLLGSLDFAIASLLNGLDFVLIGLGVLVGGLLRGVAGLLAGLGLGLTLGLLGL